jgi:hypothetical protein
MTKRESITGELEYFSNRFIPTGEQAAIANIEKLFEDAPTTMAQKLAAFTNSPRVRIVVASIEPRNWG